MVFRRDHLPQCAYCKRGAPLGDGMVMCSKKGVMAETGSCHGFRYDPLKRIPPKPKPVNFDKFDDADFSL